MTALGKYTPVNYLPFKFFPGFSKARISVQIMGMFYLALAVMSAIRAKVIFEKKPQNYITANYTFRAVALNPGNHIVEFKYRPFDVYIGATLS
ncbi:hypothetical protein J7J83_00610, partial [bacterium]|nr:hypothetical protein [bacterium]